MSPGDFTASCAEWHTGREDGSGDASAAGLDSQVLAIDFQLPIRLIGFRIETIQPEE
jgi:hypothetical protein